MEHLIQRLKDAIADSPVVGMMILNKDMEIVWFNSAMASWVEGDLDEYVGRKCHQAFSDKSEPHDNCRVVKAFETGEVQHSIEVMGKEPYLTMAIPLDDRNVGEVAIKMPKREGDSEPE